MEKDYQQSDPVPRAPITENRGMSCPMSVDVTTADLGECEVVLASTGMVRIPPIAGGAVESYVCDLARMAKSRNFKVTLVSGVREGVHVPHDRVVPVESPFDRFPLEAPVSAVAHAIGGNAVARAARRYLSQLPAGSSVVVHANEEVSATLLARVRPDIPKVFTLHNPPPQIGAPVSSATEAVLRRVGNILAMRFVMRRFDAVIALNSILKSYLVTDWNVPEDRIHCLPLPLDTDSYAPPADPNMREGILFVGRLDARKNVTSLVRAFQLMDKRTHLTLVGDGPLRDTVLSMVRRKGLERRVLLKSRLAHDELVRTYQSGAVFAFPSNLEMYPRSVIEAAACGLPVVMPRLPLYRDFIDHGFVQSYESSNDTQLAEALESLYFDTAKRKALGATARAHALSNNGYQSFSVRLASIYSGLAG